MVPGIEELTTTITRMEGRFDADPRAAEMMQRYRSLCLRFDEDLDEPGDVLLCRSAALMMIKYQLG
jgi:hypothetical protein